MSPDEIAKPLIDGYFRRHRGRGGDLATKIKRGNSWEYIVKRKALLPRPLSMTFRDEAEGDTYIARLEKLLDAGIVPPAFAGHA